MSQNETDKRETIKLIDDVKSIIDNAYQSDSGTRLDERLHQAIREIDSILIDRDPRFPTFN